MARDRLTWDKSTGDRELLLEKVMAEFAAPNESEALEIALKAALEYNRIIEAERKELRQRAQQLDGRHFAFNIRTKNYPRD